MTKEKEPQKSTSGKKTPPKKTTTKKPTPKKNNDLKISNEEKQQFPYDQFPVKVIHKDGKELKDVRTCYFQNEVHANKYITKCKFKKNEYQIFIKPQK